MTKNKVWIILGLLVAIIIVVYSLNFYFVSHLTANEHDASGYGRHSSKSSYLHHVKKRVRALKPIYLNRNPQYYKIRNKVVRNFEPKPYDNVTNVWDIAYWVRFLETKYLLLLFFSFKDNCEVCLTQSDKLLLQWPRENDIFPEFDTTMGQLLNALRNEDILQARNAPKGTQLKLLLTLAGKQKVIFKPKWYARDEVIEGPVYSGKDRFNAEIIGFYLGAILDMRWTPVAVGRQIDLKEIYEEKGDKLLRNTMTVNGNRKLSSTTFKDVPISKKNFSHFRGNHEILCVWQMLLLQ